MFEAKISDAANFRRLIEAIKDLVKNANIDVSPNGMSIQAMDSSHVALVSLNMKQNGFESYRCDKSMTLGLSIENVSKILKCAGNDDYLTLHCEEEPSSLGFNFESKSKPCFNVRRREDLWILPQPDAYGHRTAGHPRWCIHFGVHHAGRRVRPHLQRVRRHRRLK